MALLLLTKVTTVNTKKNCLAKGWRPSQELEGGPRSRPYIVALPGSAKYPGFNFTAYQMDRKLKKRNYSAKSCNCASVYMAAVPQPKRIGRSSSLTLSWPRTSLVWTSRTSTIFPTQESFNKSICQEPGWMTGHNCVNFKQTNANI